MTRSNGKIDHVDRGDGTCAYCFEEWPCEGSQGAVLSGVQLQAQEEWIVSYNKSKAKREVKIAEINELFRECKIDWQMSLDCVSQMIQVDELHALVMYARSLETAPFER